MSKSLSFCIKEINENMWQEVGRVVNLHVYPLSSGKPVKAPEINIGYNGLIMNENIWDNMFVVYNANTKCIYDNKATKLSQIAMKIEKDKVELSISNFKLEVDLNTIRNTVNCIQLMNAKYIVKQQYKDCGDNVADFLCHYLDECDIRLGYLDLSASKGKVQNYIEWLYDERSNDENMLNPPSCRIMSEESFQKVKEILNDIKLRDCNPNIIITFEFPFKEDEIEWFKIGNVILKTCRPHLK